jgi:hypothetical protein
MPCMGMPTANAIMQPDGNAADPELLYRREGARGLGGPD